MSLFNPYVLLGIVLAVLSSFGGGYYKGKHDENTRQQLEIARLNEEARQKEQALASAVGIDLARKDVRIEKTSKFGGQGVTAGF